MSNIEREILEKNPKTFSEKIKNIFINQDLSEIEIRLKNYELQFIKQLKENIDTFDLEARFKNQLVSLIDSIIKEKEEEKVGLEEGVQTSSGNEENGDNVGEAFDKFFKNNQ